MLRSLRHAAFAAVLLSATSSAAIAGPHDQAIAEIIETAVADWSVFLSCSVLDERAHDAMTDWWNEELVNLEAVLAEADIDPSLATKIAEQTSFEALLEPTTGDVASLVAYCAGTEWNRRIAMFDVPFPADDVEDLLDD